MPRGKPASARQKAAGRKNLHRANVLRKGRPRGQYAIGRRPRLPR